MTAHPLRNRARLALAGLALISAGAAHALSFDIQAPNPQDFRSVAKDLTAAIDYKALDGAAPGGLTGFSIGTFGSYSATRDSGAWQRLTGDKVDAVGLVGLRASKGLPFGLDVGGFYTRLPGSDATAWGGEVRYAILSGSVATPAVAVRGTYSRASNTGDFDYRSYGADVSISKGFLFLTPYSGVGYVRSDTRTDARFGLDPARINQAKFFTGVRFNLLLIGGTLEYERLGSNNVFSLKGGISF